jgi:hypothetical protein
MSNMVMEWFNLGNTRRMGIYYENYIKIKNNV